MTISKLLPFVLSWFFMSILLVRSAGQKRTAAAFSAIAGIVSGVIAVAMLMSLSRALSPFDLVKSCAGASFLIMWVITVTGFYRVTESRLEAESTLLKRFTGIIALICIPFCSGLMIGAAVTCRFPANGIYQLFLILISGALLTIAGMMIERKLPLFIHVTWGRALTPLVALLLFATSSSPQLDLFSPLTMKVMKFVHDVVHQAFETMLIPDHQFFKTSVWEYIGLLFGNQVGFWGGLIIWVLPPVLAGVTVLRESPPSVAHIRQGVHRRMAIAAFFTERRWRLLTPSLALLFLGAAIYQSRFPDVEYWDPKPIVVTAKPSREIFIPKKGEVELEDGKLHKFILRKNGQDVRFFFLKLPTGHLVATLDACSICKPEGYGQTDGSVICYYCKTLIPLETVGKPGGCNPVPIKFESKEDAVIIDSILLYAKWNETVQINSKSKGGGR